MFQNNSTPVAAFQDGPTSPTGYVMDGEEYVAAPLPRPWPRDGNTAVCTSEHKLDASGTIIVPMPGLPTQADIDEFARHMAKMGREPTDAFPPYPTFAEAKEWRELSNDARLSEEDRQQSAKMADALEVMLVSGDYTPPGEPMSPAAATAWALSPDFIKGLEGQILRGHPDNIRLAIEHLGIGLRQNEFSNMTEISGLAGYGPELTDPGAIRLRFLIGTRFYFLPPVDLFQDVLTDIAHLNEYHPVRDYLDNIKWDGTPRIDNWLCDYAGADDTSFNHAIGRIFLIAAVRRVRQPGVKFDTMLVFESPVQGKNKSSAMRILATREEWFTDNLPLGADPKEVIEQISGIWIVEFAELAEMATRERERITAFLSRQVDKARPAYGRRRESVKRQFVAAGTTNDTEYLPRDERRMWPVRIKLFDLVKLAKNVEQFWAEAAHYEAEGESITLQQDLWRQAEEVRADRLFENPYQATLADHFSKSVFVTSKEVWGRLAIPEERQKKASKDVGQAMHSLGFARKQCRRDGEPTACKRGDRYYTKDLEPHP